LVLLILIAFVLNFRPFHWALSRSFPPGLMKEVFLFI
jgi:hypothetical protein